MALKAGEKEIEFVYNLADEPIIINADEQQIEQALINIVKNAIEAIDGKGTVTFISTSHPAKLIISDTGKGIDASVSEFLFTPFFSTKKDGQGVGLTLIRDIMLNHHYKFSLQTVKEGTTDFAIAFDA